MNIGTKEIIGRAETIYFTRLNMSCAAKIDTGAYGSAIHASNISLKTTKNGQQILTCTLLDHPSCVKAISLRFKKFDTVEIMASNGHKESRFRVPLTFKLGKKLISTEFTLTNRFHAPFPVLLGRKSIKSSFLVDVRLSSVDYGHLKRNNKESHHWVSAEKLGKNI